MREQILKCLTIHGYRTWDEIRHLTGITENFDKVLLELVADGEVITKQVKKPNFRSTIVGYKLK